MANANYTLQRITAKLRSITTVAATEYVGVYTVSHPIIADNHATISIEIKADDNSTYVLLVEPTAIDSLVDRLTRAAANAKRSNERLASPNCMIV